MTMESDCKMGKFLEWYTQLPFPNRPSKSPTFLIQNIKCSFYLERFPSYSAYYLFLEPETAGHQLESLTFAIYSDYAKPGTFSVKQATFSPANNSLYSFNESEILNRGPNFANGYFVKFIFMFSNEDGVMLPLEKKIDEKSTQADLMVSLHTDVECLSLDFGEILKNGDHSDVQLLCNGGNIPAHKAILAARSKTFLDVFQDSTEENKAGLMNLTTTEKSVMELCLEFIYKGQILTLPVEKATDLYVLGHVFKIPSLTKMCADLMVYNLCKDNYLSSLVLADKNNDDYFKGCVIDYISDHVELLKSENWIKFSEEYMKTAIQVHQKCIFKLI